jgi:IPT/TIG domain
MRSTLALVVMLASVGCGGSASTPSAPSAPPAPGATTVPASTFSLSGMVFELGPTGRRPIAGATVEIAETTFGDIPMRPTTDLNGRYAVNGLTQRHYLARASKTGYDMSAVVDLGFLDRFRNQDFELVATGSAGPLSIATIEPSSGSTGGDVSMVITGTGFRTGSTVTFGGERVAAYASNSTTLYTSAPRHAAGLVDVVVSWATGESTTRTGGFTYVLPQSFDFNGTWVGYALAHPPLSGQVGPLHSDMDMRFTVENNMVTSFTCGGSTVVFTPTAVTNGEFTLAGDFVPITGRIVAANETTGTISTAACPATLWYAARQ